MNKQKPKRNHVPCRRCGCKHKNPASSSLCNSCGIIERNENIRIKEEMDALDRAVNDSAMEDTE